MDQGEGIYVSGFITSERGRIWYRYICIAYLLKFLTTMREGEYTAHVWIRGLKDLDALECF